MARSVRGVMASLDRHTQRRVVRLSLAIQGELIATTPRRTGWARNNWVPAIGAPPPPPPSRRAGDPGEARARMDQGRTEVLTRYTLLQGPVYVSNGVPYIGRLNRGSSQQAPTGFVELAIDRALRNV